jgi:hypothetical protein
MSLLSLGTNYYMSITTKKTQQVVGGRRTPKFKKNKIKNGVEEDLKCATNICTSRNVKRHSG